MRLMNILAHRGWHRGRKEHNSAAAVLRAFEHGFGVEVDVREQGGTLVLAHDIGARSPLSFAEFLALYKKSGGKVPIAINIKSDGLEKLLLPLLKKHKIHNYFLFDMSVPEAIRYHEAGAVCFTRQSEYEKHPAFYQPAAGVWLDEFDGPWITEKIIRDHTRKRKQVAIVSPELHGRPYRERWRFYQRMAQKFPSLMLCTDHPQEAAAFFHD